MKSINIWLWLRMIIALFFIVSGAEKLLMSYQNFLYVVQSYEILPVPLEAVVAHVVPWIELLGGIFLLLGLALSWVGPLFLLLTSAFIIVVSQALIRGLPITECGCFGELLSIPLPVVLIFDMSIFMIIGLLIWKKSLTQQWSLDKYLGD